MTDIARMNLALCEQAHTHTRYCVRSVRLKKKYSAVMHSIDQK